MKKLFCLLLSLMLLALCPAMAENVEDADAVQVMTSPNGDYSFEVPAGYFTMDAEWFASLMEQEEFQEILVNALGLPDAAALQTNIQMIEASNMMIVYASDFIANLNVQATPASLTMDMLVAMKNTMDAAMIQQYATLGVAEEDIVPMDVQQIGTYRWYGLKLTMAGMQMQTAITVVDGVQYTITFTGLEEAAVQHVLESFQVIAPAAEE